MLIAALLLFAKLTPVKRWIGVLDADRIPAGVIELAVGNRRRRAVDQQLVIGPVVHLDEVENVIGPAENDPRPRRR